MKNKLIKGVAAVVFAGFIGLLVLNSRSAEPRNWPGLSEEIKELDRMMMMTLPPNVDQAIVLQLIQVKQLKRIADTLQKMEWREARKEEQERK